MSLHLQPDWHRSLGQYVEVRLHGRPVRTGLVEAVMPDCSALWVAADGPDARQMLAKADGYEVFTHYEWVYPDGTPPETPTLPAPLLR